VITWLLVTTVAIGGRYDEARAERLRLARLRLAAALAAAEQIAERRAGEGIIVPARCDAERVEMLTAGRLEPLVRSAKAGRRRRAATTLPASGQNRLRHLAPAGEARRQGQRAARRGAGPWSLQKRIARGNSSFKCSGGAQRAPGQCSSSPIRSPATRFHYPARL